MSSPLKRILNNLTIQIIFEYFMDIYNKLFPYGNIHPRFCFVCSVVKTDGHTNTHFPNLKFEHEKKNESMNHTHYNEHITHCNAQC